MSLPLLLLAYGSGLPIAAKAAREASKPNLLFMMADQLRADTQGADARFGGAPNTPNLDKLAAEGLRFTNSYSSTPTCTPARAAILTGLSPWNHGMLGYGAIAHKYPFEMPVALQAIGYSTSSIGKDHFGWDSSTDLPPLDPKTDTGDKGSGTPHGYERMSLYDGLVGQPDDYHQWFTREMPGHKAEEGWPTLSMNSWMGAPFVFEEYLHPTAWVGQQAVDWIANVSTDRPWFLKVSFHRPHSPYDPPARVLNATSASMLPTVQLAEDGWDRVFHGGEGYPSGCGPHDPQAWCGLMPQAEQQLARRSYYANVAFIDEWVGKILGALDQRDLTKNTFILWTADHGDGQGDHYHWRKGFPYQFSANVPLIFRWPESYGPTKTPRGTVITELVTELRDVFPTMLDAAGAMDTIPANHTLDGTSLLCLLHDATGAACRHQGGGQPAGPGWRPWLDLEHSLCYNASNHWSALTDGKMKYIFNACPTCSFPPREQLFNLTADPGERHGLHADPAYELELAKWRGRMVRQFEAEGRGDAWVKGGELQPRPKQTYSPHYPGHHGWWPGSTCKNVSLAAGDKLNLEPEAGDAGTNVCQDLIASRQLLSLVVAPKLCVAATGTALVLDNCDPATAAKKWRVESAIRDPPAEVIHAGSGLCLTGNAAGAVFLAKCPPTEPVAVWAQLQPEANLTKWTSGPGGRLCNSAGCLSVVAGQAAGLAHPWGGVRRSFLR